MNKNIQKTQKTQETKRLKRPKRVRIPSAYGKLLKKLKTQNTSQPPRKSAKVSRKLQSKKCHFTRKNNKHTKSKKMGPKCLYGL